MTEHSDFIAIDLGNPEVPPYDMKLEITLPLSLKPEKIQALLGKAAEARQWFLDELAKDEG